MVIFYSYVKLPEGNLTKMFKDKLIGINWLTMINCVMTA